MTVSTNLSVAEMGHQSDRVGMKQDSYTFRNGQSSSQVLQLEVTNQQTLVLKYTRQYSTPSESRYGPKPSTTREYKEIEFDKCDIDSLILFLQDAKEFVREDLVYRKLKGSA